MAKMIQGQLTLQIITPKLDLTRRKIKFHNLVKM